MKMQKSVSVVPLLLLLCLSGVRVTKGQGVEVTKAKSVDFKTEFEVKTPADGKADGQTDLWAELRDMVVEQRVEKREAVTQSQLEDSKTQNSGKNLTWSYNKVKRTCFESVSLSQKMY
jgi:DNA-directed RNA polymerase specialized sigma24 family protein